MTLPELSDLLLASDLPRGHGVHVFALTPGTFELLALDVRKRCPETANSPPFASITLTAAPGLDVRFIPAEPQ